MDHIDCGPQPAKIAAFKVRHTRFSPTSDIIAITFPILYFTGFLCKITTNPKMAREPVAGPESGPQQPFPIKLQGKIIKGFGRGSKELGIPTANIPIEGLDVGGHKDVESGVYYGWAGVNMSTATADNSKAAGPPGAATDASDKASNDSIASNRKDQGSAIYPAVLSIGYNPYYKNEKRSVEVHLAHKFESDFYNALMNLSILGFIRHEQDYGSLDALIEDIKTDTTVAKQSLARPAYEDLKQDPYLMDFSWAATSGRL